MLNIYTFQDHWSCVVSQWRPTTDEECRMPDFPRERQAGTDCAPHTPELCEMVGFFFHVNALGKYLREKVACDVYFAFSLKNT